MNLERFMHGDLQNLTGRQRTAIQLALAGKSLSEIGAEMGCTKQNVSCLMKSADKRLDAPPTQKRTPRKPKPHKDNPYQAYAHMDHSTLSPREREALQLMISGKTYSQTANEMRASIGCVGVLLQRARMKLDGRGEELRHLSSDRSRRYREKFPEKVKASSKRSYLKHREKCVAKMKGYNREYYQTNRERILKRQKERHDKEG